MKAHPTIEIAGKKIGLDYPCFMIAEMSGNHGQNFEKALEIVKAASASGADAIKLQTYTPDTITINSKKKWFFESTNEETPELWKGKSSYELYQTAYTPWEWQPKLKKLADELGIVLFSTPFDETAVDFLEKEVNPPCYKIASSEATHIPLIKKVAETKKPVIISIGMATLKEVELAISTLKQYGSGQIAILHCTASYSENPKLEEVNLRTIRDLAERFGLVSGFSDNNAGIEIPEVAAVMGASIIEKHFIVSRSWGGPDATFSLEPGEFKEMVARVRNAERMLGSEVKYGPLNQMEEENRNFRQSIWVAKEMRKGEEFTRENTIVRRPQVGLMPRFYESVLGKRAAQNIEAVTPLTSDLIQGFDLTDK